PVALRAVAIAVAALGAARHRRHLGGVERDRPALALARLGPLDGTARELEAGGPDLGETPGEPPFERAVARILVEEPVEPRLFHDDEAGGVAGEAVVRVPDAER